jgi:hypothetical protein
MEKDNSSSSHVDDVSLEPSSSPHHGQMAATGPDESSAAARGGALQDLPPNYYWHWRFVGSVAAVTFMAQSLYLG